MHTKLTTDHVTEVGLFMAASAEKPIGTNADEALVLELVLGRVQLYAPQTPRLISAEYGTQRKRALLKPSYPKTGPDL